MFNPGLASLLNSRKWLFAPCQRGIRLISSSEDRARGNNNGGVAPEVQRSGYSACLTCDLEVKELLCDKWDNHEQQSWIVSFRHRVILIS